MALGRKTWVNFARKSSKTFLRNAFFIPKQNFSLLNYYQPKFTNLFTQLTNNKLQNCLSQTSTSHPGCKELLEAINFGNHEHDIFADPVCSLYLLALIRDRKIAFNTGISVYQYLIGLMNFTNLQPLAPEHQDFKVDRAFSVIKFAEDGELTDTGKKYLHAICEEFQKFSYQVDFESCRDFILTLSPSELWLSKLSLKPGYMSQYDNMMEIIGTTVPFLIEVECGIRYLPSVSIINFLFNQMSPKPLRVHPVFGLTKHDVYLKMLKGGFHPGALYHPLASDNLVGAHGISAGPFAMLVHDWTHAFWINLFSEDDQKIIHESAQRIQHLKALAFNKGYNSLYEDLHLAQVYLLDFDLHEIQKFYCPKTRLSNYLQTFQKIMDTAATLEDKPVFSLGQT